MEVVDLSPEALAGEGPLWGTATEDLNATLLAWPPGQGTPEHVNAERDVLVVGLAGSGIVTVDGEARSLRALEAVMIEKGYSRQITAGSEGFRYLSVHLRRPGLELSRLGRD